MLSETNLEKYDLSENMIPETQTQSNSTPPLVLTFSAFQILYEKTNKSTGNQIMNKFSYNSNAIRGKMRL